MQCATSSHWSVLTLHRKDPMEWMYGGITGEQIEAHTPTTFISTKCGSTEKQKKTACGEQIHIFFVLENFFQYIIVDGL